MVEPIGYVVGGGLRDGLRVRLTVEANVVQEGSFIVCDSGGWRFYGLITDMQLGATDPRFADEQTHLRMQPAIQARLLGKTLFTTLNMYPTLMQAIGPELGTSAHATWQTQVDEGEIELGVRPVKTVPAHHAPVRLADKGDVAEIFGGDFVIGHTIEQGHEVGLDLKRLVKRSSGIFGATGTGKSFLTRMVLAGVMRDNVAGALVFDMHNEYGFADLDSDRGVNVLGLQDIFGRQRVSVAALGADTMVRGRNPDFTLAIGLKDITQADILLLSDALSLNESATVVLSELTRSEKRDWLKAFIALTPGKKEYWVDDNGKERDDWAPDSVEGWAKAHNQHPASALALHRKLGQITAKPYVVDKPKIDAVRAIVDRLENGQHVILSFGQYESDLDYLLVSNILTRRIREHWVQQTERFKAGEGPEPRPLMIAIEEAHKLLSPTMARQTAFGIIARELRKYFVTLLVIDQRPSGIDDEIMSQLGTRITGWLGDEDDIRAVLSGLAGRDQLRGMLARLQEKQEVLLLGWGVKMPIPIRSRRYDDDFYAEMRQALPTRRAPRTESLDDLNADLFG